MGELGRGLIFFGVALIVVGGLFLLGPRVPFLGKLPGDFLLRGEHSTLYVPLATCLVLSLVLSILLNIFWR